MKYAWLVGLLGLLVTDFASAAWQLDSEHSHLHFISTKNAQIAEVHTFKTVSGMIDAQGQAQVVIDLTSVDTNIATRDQRLRDMLFETKRFSVAKITSAIDLPTLQGLNTGEFIDVPLSAQLNLHGVQQKITATVRVVKLSQNRLSVTSLKPLLVVPSVFGLESGLNALREVAKLLSIANSVPVTLDWVFVYHPD
ncbi:MAG: YceI family protein [Methylococcales bacterium]|nr:YceI family protein [Methylococcales bacterium]